MVKYILFSFYKCTLFLLLTVCVVCVVSLNNGILDNSQLVLKPNYKWSVCFPKLSLYLNIYCSKKVTSIILNLNTFTAY